MKKIDKATEDALKAKRDEALKAREKLEKDLKSKYGKKKEEWPSDVQDQYFQAVENAAVANANYEYKKVEPEGLENSATDIIESIQGKGMTADKKNVSLVKTADEAQLAIEVIGRRSARSGSGGLIFGGIRPDEFFVCFTLAPGKKLDPARFAQLPHNWHFKKFAYSAWKLSSPSADNPVYTFESFAEQGWGTAGNTAAFLIDQFIRDNYTILSGTN
ncbi:MAG TPA: hypothetical protein VFG11_11865 [Acidobacteriota bacterium]|nr:hypothetical protein [Acidobacteriota bacterium]